MGQQYELTSKIENVEKTTPEFVEMLEFLGKLTSEDLNLLEQVILDDELNGNQVKRMDTPHSQEEVHQTGSPERSD
jgi:hypothetical protein